MVWCSKCGVSGDKERLFDAISDKGIVRVCQKCAVHEGWPVIKRPADLYQKKAPVQPPIQRDAPVKMGRDSKSMFDRLTRLSGVVMAEKKEENREMLKQNKSLRDMANRNFESKIVMEKGDTSELIDNFNWAIMRARRALHLSQTQLAEAIGESEAAIRRAEQGVLPPNGNNLARKIGSYLKIHLFLEGSQQVPKELRFDPVSSVNLTISDLKNTKQHGTEFTRSGNSSDNMPAENNQGKEQEEAELSDEEVDKILFGKG